MDRSKLGKPMKLQCVTETSKHYGETHTYSDWKKFLPYGVNFTINGGCLGQKHVVKVELQDQPLLVLEEI